MSKFWKKEDVIEYIEMNKEQSGFDKDDMFGEKAISIIQGILNFQERMKGVEIDMNMLTEEEKHEYFSRRSSFATPLPDMSIFEWEVFVLSLPDELLFDLGTQPDHVVLEKYREVLPGWIGSSWIEKIREFYHIQPHPSDDGWEIISISLEN